MSAVRVITVPNGRQVTLGQYAQTWRDLLQAETNPDEMVRGWDHFAVERRHVLRDMRRGLEDRINKRGNAQPKTLSDRRLFTKIRNAALRGAIRYECKWCGSALDPLAVNPYNAMTRFCDSLCRNAHSR